MFVIGLLTIAMTAQGTTATSDLSGTWEFVERNSPFKDRLMVITQAGDELSIVETYLFENDPYTQTATFYTDGRGEVYVKQLPGGQASQTTAKTIWKKGKLFRTLRYAYMMDNRGMRYKVTVDEEQTWSFSKDGETLTIDIRSKRDAPAIAPIPVPTTSKAAYRRKR